VKRDSLGRFAVEDRPLDARPREAVTPTDGDLARRQVELLERIVSLLEQISHRLEDRADQWGPRLAELPGHVIPRRRKRASV